MPINPRKLQTPTARRELAIQGKPYWHRIAPGLFLGYRRCEGPGRWCVRDAAGKVTKFALADDREPANGNEVMSWAQAEDHAKKVVRPDTGTSEACTVADALLVAYKNDLIVRGKLVHNATTIHKHIAKTVPALLKRDVNLVTAKEWRDLRSTLIANGLSKMSWNRLTKGLCAALNLVAPDRKNIWRPALATVSDDRPVQERAHNVVLAEAEVLKWIAASYAESHNFGLLIDVLATTGARPSQAVRLLVRDLFANEDRLDMPKSGKGGGKRQGERRQERYRALIPASLTQRLQEAAQGRKPNDFLLVRDDGQPWVAGQRAYVHYYLPAQRVLGRIRLTIKDDMAVTVYALRHTSITRMLLRNVPARVVAAAHDTSVGEIEKHYSAYILNHADELVRGALLDHGTITPLKKVA